MKKMDLDNKKSLFMIPTFLNLERMLHILYMEKSEQN